MKAKFSLVLVGLILGFFLCHFGKVFLAYVQLPRHVAQGERIMERLVSYRDANNQWPDQKWFQELGDQRRTTEGRKWIYHHPPLKLSNGKELLISVPIKYGRKTLGGYLDGTVSVLTDR